MQASNPSWSRSDIAALCSVGALIESKMAHEISLIGHRMTWLVVSESLMFSAFVLVFSSQDFSPHPTESLTGTWIMSSLPVLGVVLVCLVWPGLFAARNAMHMLTRDRAEIDEILERVSDLKLAAKLGPKRIAPLWNPRWGDLSLFGVPGILILAWVLAYAAPRVHISFG